ncbi:MAG: hypothetical protein ACR2PX_07600 [Endozoicomonas sp.]|uniref:2OG-Fe(II)-dependent halogenase WelO5 family protein n=1 Tax=Endozoicomonas sp. TaxID=1892382 RepID=UPI003D9B5C89
MYTEVKKAVGQHSNTKFYFTETDAFDPKTLIDVLDGKSLGTIIRGFVDLESCTIICDNFSSHEGRYERGQDAPATYVGAYHYHKELDQYFQESELANKVLGQLFSKTGNPVERINNALDSALNKHQRILRPAQWKGKMACQFVMRSWSDSGDFSLAPHEDEAQCKDPGQAGFEIQEAIKENNALCAVNICLENGSGGLLRIWDIRPDDAMREKYNVEFTGSPYPLEAVKGVAFIDVEIRPGDLYAFDGRFVHAVTQLEDKTTSSRSTISYLLSHKGKGETMQWA